MYFLAFDVSQRTHECMLLDEEDQVLWRLTIRSNRAGFEALAEQLRDTDPQTVVAGLEATGPYWQTLHLWLLRWKPAKVLVLNPLQTKAYRNTNLRGSKTDRLDTKSIGELLRFTHRTLSNAHVPEDRQDAIRQINRLKTELTQQRASELVRLHGMLAVAFPEFAELFKLSTKSARALLLRWPTPQALVKAASLEEVTALLRQTSRGRMGQAHAEALLRAAQGSVGVPDPHDGHGAVIRTTLALIEMLEEQADALGSRIETLLVGDQLETATLLGSLPGFGAGTVHTWIAELPPIERFKAKNGAERIAASIGIDAKLRESGRFAGRVKMSKRGNRYLRRAILLAARTAARCDPQCRAILLRHQNRGKHYNVAISHVARKLVHIAYSVLINKKPYEVPPDYRLGITQEPELAASGT
jgi:transposase